MLSPLLKIFHYFSRFLFLQPWTVRLDQSKFIYLDDPWPQFETVNDVNDTQILRWYWMVLGWVKSPMNLPLLGFCCLWVASTIGSSPEALKSLPPPWKP